MNVFSYLLLMFVCSIEARSGKARKKNLYWSRRSRRRVILTASHLCMARQHIWPMSTQTVFSISTNDKVAKKRSGEVADGGGGRRLNQKILANFFHNTGQSPFFPSFHTKST